MLFLSRFFFQKLSFSHFWPLLAFFVVFVVVFRPWRARGHAYMQLHSCISGCDTISFYNKYFSQSPFFPMITNHQIILSLPYSFLRSWHLESVLRAPPVNNPVNYSLYGNLLPRHWPSMLFLSLLCLLAPILGHCPLCPPFPGFVFHAFRQNSKTNRIVTFLFFFRFGDVSVYLLIAKSV